MLRVASKTHLQSGVSHELVPRPILSMEVDRAASKAQEDAVAGIGIGDIDSRVLQQLLHVVQVTLHIGACLQAQPLEYDQAVILPLLIKLVQSYLSLLA